MFYRYRYNILNILLISDFNQILVHANSIIPDINIYKPVYNKIYLLYFGSDNFRYGNIHYIDYRSKFEKIQTDADYIMFRLDFIKSITLSFNIMEKIDNLIFNYYALINKIDNIFGTNN